MQKDHEELKCSHEKLQDSHAMLQVANLIMVTLVKHNQPLTQKCKCSQNSIEFICANPCCSQRQQSSVEQVLYNSGK
jgi:hypothetical protein